MNYPEPPEAAVVFTSTPMNMGITAAEPYSSQHCPATQPAHDYALSLGYDHSASGAPHFVEASYNHYASGTSPPPMYADDSDLAAPGSNLSTASTSSSIMGSPLSHHGQPSNMHDWVAHQQQLPCIVDSSNEYYHTGSSTEYPLLSSSSLDGFAPSFEYGATGKPCVDPALTIHAEARPMILSGYEGYPASAPLASSAYPHSPAYSTASQVRGGSLSPSFLPHTGYQQQLSQFPPQPTDGQGHSPSLGSYHSPYSGEPPYSGDESKEKQRCPHANCGKIFKDLKAHMLTHQTERPEKCPIATCDYHIKGFARKYDKNRHTLTHYKGTMVCGFCPGSGSAAEKSFNRADVFKRHLTAVHGVEQTPPNSRRKAAAAAAGSLSGVACNGSGDGGKPLGYAADATGKCSTCSQTFSNAQEFYEHLDDCVLRIVQQEDPSEAINAKRLAEVENDRNVYSTLQKNSLLTVIKADPEDEASADEDDEAMIDDEDHQQAEASTELGSRPGRKLGSSPPAKCRVGPSGGIQKTRNAAQVRAGRPASGAPAAAPTAPSSSSPTGSKIQRRGPAARREYPSSWGFDKAQMSVKKRVLAVFNGSQRLARDDMALSTEHEVRVQLGDGRSYVTDLDVHTLRRAEGFLASDRGIAAWGSSGAVADEDYTKMLDFSNGITAATEAA